MKQKAGLLLFAFLLSSLNILGLTGPPNGDPPCGGEFGECIPIDGGISWLFALGAIYGAKKALTSWKNKKAV